VVYEFGYILLSWIENHKLDREYDYIVFL